MRRNALYARQSIDKKDSISIDTQLEKARLECMLEDSVTTYTDRGYSGKNTDRPAFRKLMGDVAQGMIDRIVVYKLDRFSRSILDFAKAWEILAEHHVEFVSVNEKFDTSTPIGKAMLYITIVFAQMERETIAERITDNYYSRVAEGSWPGGPAPYGFRNGRREEGGRRVSTLIATNDIGTVELIYQRYAEEAVSLGELSRYLKQELKIPGPRHAVWNRGELSRLLKNPVYVQADVDIYRYYRARGVKMRNGLEEFSGERGGLLVGKHDTSTGRSKPIDQMTFTLGNWEGRIPSDIWLACQQKLSRNRQIKNEGKGKHTWLSGLLKCGYCGRAFRIVVDSKYPVRKYMYCAGRQEMICDQPIEWKLQDVEALVEKELVAELEKNAGRTEEVVGAISNSAKMELQEIEDKTDNLAANLRNAKVSPAAMELINRELEKLDQEKQRVLQEIENRKPRKIVYDKIDFPSLDMQEKKIVARQYIKKVFVTNEECVIEWRV